MALSQYYVDPSIAADSGTGTIGDPFGDLQYALNNITRNATSGDQINVKAGTDEVLAASLTLATYGTPSTAAPLVIRGYTSAANDGGIGGISGAGTYTMFASTTYTSIHIIDMHLHNTGSANLVYLGLVCSLIGCELNNSQGYIRLGNASVVMNCYIYDIGGQWAVYAGGRGGNVINCYIKAGPTYTPTYGIYLEEGAASTGNIIVCSGAMIGMYCANDITFITNNSVYSSGGTGKGVLGYPDFTAVIVNNIIEGFSGAGGVGIDVAGAASLVRNNALYNNTTNVANDGDAINSTQNNTLSASAFVDAANGDFTIDGTVTNVTEFAWPSDWPGLTTDTSPLADLGAVQAGAGAGGSSVYRRVARLLGG